MGIERVADLEVFETATHGCEKVAAGLVQVVVEQRRGRDNAAIALVLGVQDAQRIARQPVAALFGQRIAMGAEVINERRAIAPAAIRVAQRVEFQGRAVEHAERLQDLGAEGDDFNVTQRLANTQQLDVDLVELALAPFLGPFVAEHGAGAERLDGQAVLQSSTQEGAGHARRRFGPQCDLALFLAVPTIADGERVHLLRDDVRSVAQSP